MYPDNLLAYTTADYIATLPGYTAQVLTFGTMIIFLIIIVAFVLGIFIYVLTIQKTPMFGVDERLKDINLYIAKDLLLMQTNFLLRLYGYSSFGNLF